MKVPNWRAKEDTQTSGSKTSKSKKKGTQEETQECFFNSK